MPMKSMARRLALFQLTMLFLLTLAPLHPIYAAQEGSCSYKLDVKTTNKIIVLNKHSGTRAPVHVRFRNTAGIEVLQKHLNEGDEENRFKPGQTDSFDLRGECLQGKICLLDFFVDGDDDWKPEFATVHGTNLESATFNFGKKLPLKAWDGKNFCGVVEQVASFQSQYYDNGGSDNNRNVQRHCNPRGGRRIRKTSC